VDEQRSSADGASGPPGATLEHHRPVIRVRVPVYLPVWLYRSLRGVRDALVSPPSPGLDLWGDRDVECAFVAAHLPPGPGHALDFGCGNSFLSAVAAARDFDVVAVDLEAQHWHWRHANVRFVQGNFFDMGFAEGMFDLVINCSAVEHVGLPGRYGVQAAEADGDLRVMEGLRRVLRPGGTMLISVPAGRDAVHAPLHRVYGPVRLPRLLDGFLVEREEYWVKDSQNRWARNTREAALSFEAVPDYRVPFRSIYALACFVLRKPAP
jgi:SAM-dependent methyltransferase